MGAQPSRVGRIDADHQPEPADVVTRAWPPSLARRNASAAAPFPVAFSMSLEHFDRGEHRSTWMSSVWV
jgi:hypothetical protein